MKWAFDLLELPPDADATSIKRAYARLLRNTRPDENPEGFQRLHAAYKTALAQANSSMPEPMAAPAEVAGPSAASMTNAAVAEMPAAVTRQAPQPVTPTPVRAINIGALANEVIRAATSAADSRELSTWLQSRQDFWSIQAKQQTGQAVIQRLFQRPQVMSADCLDAVLRFFDLDHVLSGINPFALQQLRRRQSLQWELMPEHHHELMERVRLPSGGRLHLHELHRYLALLQQPPRWPAVVKIALQGGALDHLEHFAQALCQGHFDDLPASFDRRSVQFWHKAYRGGGMTGPRFAVNMLRVAAIGFICALFIVIVFAVSFAAGNMPGEQALRLASTFSFAILGGLVGIWLLVAGWICLDNWQGLPESAPSSLPWLRRLLIPALCTIGWGLHEVGGVDYLAGPLVFASLFFSLRRYSWRIAPHRQRQGLPIRTMLRWLYIGGICLAGLLHLQRDADFPIIPAAAAAAFGIWLADMWRHRAYLHPKLARD